MKSEESRSQKWVLYRYLYTTIVSTAPTNETAGKRKRFDQL